MFTSYDENNSLRQIHKWLKVEWLGSGLLFFAFLVPGGLILEAGLTAAVFFTPFMVWHLVKAGWLKAIAIFVVTVGVPLIGSVNYEAQSMIVSYLLNMSPVVAYLLYMIGLRLVIKEHLDEARFSDMARPYGANNAGRR